MLQCGVSKSYTMLYIKYGFDIKDKVENAILEYSKSLDQLGYHLKFKERSKLLKGHFYIGVISLK